MSENASHKNHLKWLLPILILLLAGLVSFAIMSSRKAPEKKARMMHGILVETVPVHSQKQQAVVHATGTVEPRQEISLVAEVNGALAWVDSRFVEGGFFRKGEKLLEIDPRDYQLAVQKARADLARARIGLQTEEEQAGIARREWERLELPDKGEPGALVLRQPQLEGEKASLAAAQAGLDQARLNLERTTIRAPFSGRLRSKQVDLGEYVRIGTPLGVLAGTDQAEIIVPLPIEDLRWLEIPAAGSGQPGSAGTVSTLIGRARYSWQGAITRTFGEIDPTSRMAKIAISVKDPYNLDRRGDGHGMPLANGMFVEVEMAGASFDQIVSIPRNALREGGVVWLADEHDQLEIRPVHVLRRQKSLLLIDQGLSDGDRLILTNISAAAAGMKLRPQQRESQP